MLKKFLLLSVCCALLFAQNADSDKLEEGIKSESIKQRVMALDESIKDNILYKRYGNYMSYQKILEELNGVDAEVKKLKNARDKASVEKYEKLISKQESLEKQISLLQEYKNTPINRMLDAKEIELYPKITNPFAIISALSYIKNIKQDSMDFKSRLDVLDALVSKIRDKVALLEELSQLEKTPVNENMLFEAQKELYAFTGGQDVAHTSYSLHVKKIEEVSLRVSQDITLQMKQAFNIGIVIVIVIIMTLLLKMVAKRYIKDSERFYTANKIINFANATLILLILLFSYIENVSYLVTVLGFASAGIAIAMKDWFMSILGWMVIIFGGSFHVGDRIKVQKDGLLYVGDIIDISLLRMTIFEDVTISTYMENRRAGRIVFIPNNYVFTSLISNYTHDTLRTVWDGIDIFITFDSNHKKAQHLVREIVKKYSKGYTDIARKQINLLRHHYSLKNSNVEPRIFTFIEPHGVCVSAWYMTNAYATLTLRSTISAEIVDAFMKEEDITIAYPTQNINLGSQKKRVLPSSTEPKGGDEKSLF